MLKEKNFKERFKSVLSDPCNKLIPRVTNAGQIVDGYYVMHNGLKVLPYYGNFSQIFELNKGVHEPQEEYVFQEILKRIPDNGTIIELGSYWGFYSMWFCQKIKNAKAILVDSSQTYLDVGKQNFVYNNMMGTFICGKIGVDTTLDNLVNNYRTQHKNTTVNIVHADIQGAEVSMLYGARQSLQESNVDYFFISSHSQDKHEQCLHILKKYHYTIIAEADFDYDTYCYDGIIVAQSPMIKHKRYFVLGSRANGT